MSTEPIEVLMTRIMDQYNRKPEGWRVLTDGKGNMLVLGPGVAYRLKLIPLNPEEYTGVGIRIGGLKEMRRVMEGIPSYGFRPLSASETKELFNTIHQGGTRPRIVIITSTRNHEGSNLHKRYKRFFGRIEYYPIGFETFSATVKEYILPSNSI